MQAFCRPPEISLFEQMGADENFWSGALSLLGVSWAREEQYPEPDDEKLVPETVVHDPPTA